VRYLIASKLCMATATHSASRERASKNWFNGSLRRAVGMSASDPAA
jgi:hypothetical protein